MFSASGGYCGDKLRHLLPHLLSQLRHRLAGGFAKGFQVSAQQFQIHRQRFNAFVDRHPYTSRFFTSSALSSMNLRRFSTSSPISVEKISSLSTASSRRTTSSVRFSGFMVVSASCSAFISPRPL